MFVHHIGYYVTNLEESKKKFECLGYVVEQSVVYDFQRGIKVLFLNGDSVRVELIEIVDREHCDIEHMRYNKGACPYHICYEVENIELAIEELKKQHFKIIRKKAKAKAINYRTVVFLYNKNVGMIELVER